MLLYKNCKKTPYQISKLLSHLVGTEYWLAFDIQIGPIVFHLYNQVVQEIQMVRAEGPEGLEEPEGTEGQVGTEGPGGPDKVGQSKWDK